MSSEEIYAVLYYITVFTHYFITAGVFIYISRKKLKLSFVKMQILWFAIWLSAGIVFRGCPYTYVEEHFAHKAWGVEKKYDLKESLAYKIVLKHVL